MKNNNFPVIRSVEGACNTTLQISVPGEPNSKVTGHTLVLNCDVIGTHPMLERSKVHQSRSYGLPIMWYV